MHAWFKHRSKAVTILLTIVGEQCNSYLGLPIFTKACYFFINAVAKKIVPADCETLLAGNCRNYK